MGKMTPIRDNFIIKAPAKGESMAPLIKDGCQLVVSLNKDRELEIGDIVLIFLEKKWGVHRIIKIFKNKNSRMEYITKGDNNLRVDGRFSREEIVGIVEKIIYPDYEINLKGRKNQILKYFFVIYSWLNMKFPIFLKARRIYRFKPFKLIYRFLIKS